MSRALLFNDVASGPTFLVEALLASFEIDATFLLRLAPGSILYIAAFGLVPEVNRGHGPPKDPYHTAVLPAGAALLYALGDAFGR
jgi:zinc transporter ZupT